MQSAFDRVSGQLEQAEVELAAAQEAQAGAPEDADEEAKAALTTAVTAAQEKISGLNEEMLALAEADAAGGAEPAASLGAEEQAQLEVLMAAVESAANAVNDIAPAEGGEEPPEMTSRRASLAAASEALAAFQASLAEPEDGGAGESGNGGEGGETIGTEEGDAGDGDTSPAEPEPEPEPEPEEDPREVMRRKRHLVEHLQRLQSKKESLIQENTGVQTTIAELMKRKKEKGGKDATAKSAKNVTDQEIRFQKMLTAIRDLEADIETEQKESMSTVTEMTTKRDESRHSVDGTKERLSGLSRKVAANVVSTRTGKKVSDSTYQELFAAQDEKDRVVEGERLRFLKHRNKLHKLEIELKAKEQLGDGLHFIDFEQLKIENQSHNEKIEERNEELTKLRNKITTTVQVLSHLKEKLDWVEIENGEMTTEVRRIEKLLAQKRDQVSRQKRNRDRLRKENTDLVRQCGLINQKLLLRDFEVRYDEVTECAALVDDLQSKHAVVQSKTQGFKVRLGQLKVQQPELFTWDS